MQNDAGNDVVELDWRLIVCSKFTTWKLLIADACWPFAFAMASKLAGIFKGKLKRKPDCRIVALLGRQKTLQAGKRSGSKLPAAAKVKGSSHTLDNFRSRWDQFKTKWVPKRLGAADSLSEVIFHILNCWDYGLLSWISTSPSSCLARYGVLKHKKTGKAAVTTWLVQRPSHWGGEFAIGCHICSCLLAKVSSSGCSVTSSRRRCSTRWSRMEVYFGVVVFGPLAFSFY